MGEACFDGDWLFGFVRELDSLLDAETDVPVTSTATDVRA